MAVLGPHARVDVLLMLAGAATFTGLVFALVAAALGPGHTSTPPPAVVTGPPASPAGNPPAPHFGPAGGDKHDHLHPEQ